MHIRADANVSSNWASSHPPCEPVNRHVTQEIGKLSWRRIRQEIARRDGSVLQSNTFCCCQHGNLQPRSGKLRPGEGTIIASRFCYELRACVETCACSKIARGRRQIGTHPHGAHPVKITEDEHTVGRKESLQRSKWEAHGKAAASHGQSMGFHRCENTQRAATFLS